ncbi:MAG: lipoate--protein ligase family protein [Acidobacteriota bacterium]|nr:MAG: lipoate--protein ligase family protein [Acidobacteriota bacterium]
MRTDWELLLEAENSDTPLTVVRFYRWERPTVSLGKHQIPERSIDFLFCQDSRIPVIHRPTGGRAVLHADELTYAVASNDSSLFGTLDIRGTYQQIGETLQAGLERIGAETVLSRGKTDPGLERNALQSSPCFSTASRSELTATGRKIAGSAQRRLRKSFLQHGSIPLLIDYRLMSQVLKYPEEFLRSRMISVSEAVGHPVPFESVAEALREAFTAWH